MADSLIGRTLGHYRIVEELGSGGMGAVYRARDERLERDVALKVVRGGAVGDAEARQRFRKEALALSRFNHSHIASIYDFDSEEGTDFIVMEYVPGVTLSHKLAEGPLSEPEVIFLGAQLAEALQEAHVKGLVHRDLKPGNIMITPRGQAKVLDFGLAQLLRPRSDEATTEALSDALTPAGTLPYMAPEQLRGGRVDARTDVYAAGAVLYEMAAGQPLFPGRRQLVLSLAILNERPVSPRAVNPALTSGLEGVILKALSKDPDGRHGSALDLKQELERLAAPGSAPPPLVGKRRAVVALAGGVAVAMALGLAGWSFRDEFLGPLRSNRFESLAVLPLENLTRDPSQDYFADGMTEALIANLAKIQSLHVISRTSVMRYKGTQRLLPEIARELGVDAVVEGSVLRSEGRVRITAQLIDAANDRHLWAESYEREIEDVLSLQREVARAIVGEIQAQVTQQELKRLSHARPVAAAAYEAYLEGRHHWSRRTSDSLLRAIERFEAAAAVDPDFRLTERPRWR
jgi:TolB-like protein/predicted Ser/Thr protein kinase